MILKDYCTERPLLAIEVLSAEVETCNMRLFHPPLGLSIFYGSRDQLRPGSLPTSFPGSSLFLRKDPISFPEPAILGKETKALG